MLMNVGAKRNIEFYQPILLVISILLIVLGTGMLVPAIVDYAGGAANLWAFPTSAGITMFVGGSMFLATMSSHFTLSIRQAFVMTTSIWIVLPMFGSLPFMLGELHMSFTDAFFESMSGITTTGSTVITGLDGVSSGLLLWRATLQWLGGLGIIVISISVMPMLRIGGMQMFKVEAFDTGEKALPRAAQISAGVTMVYVTLTAVCTIALLMTKMTGLESVTHAMTTIATGGYSTSDESIGHFNNAAIDAIITVGMIIGGLPFMLILISVRGRFSRLLQDAQVHWYLGILLCATITVSGWLFITQGMELLSAIRYSSFTVASIMTGTGFVSTDYTIWGVFPIIILFFLTFVGGCTGSTACGIKVFRFLILASIARVEFHKILMPNGVFIPYFNNRQISDEVISSVLNFFVIFILCFVLLTLALGMLGLDFITAISSAATAISNVGPGLGPIVGPTGTFQPLPDAAKWLLGFGMLIGRLEVFTVIILFTRHFWRS